MTVSGGGNPVTLSLYSSPQAIPQPSEPSEPSEPLRPKGASLSRFRRLPTDRYLQADGSLSACTKILRCAQDDCGRREGGCLKSDVWCLNVSVLSGIPLSGQRIADSGKRTAVQLSGGRSRNAVFVFIAEGDTTTLGPKGRSPPSTQPAAVRRPQPSGPKARPPSPLEPSEPLRPEGASLSHWHWTSFRDILSLITFGTGMLPADIRQKSLTEDRSLGGVLTNES